MTSSPLIKPERQGMSFAFDWVDSRQNRNAGVGICAGFLSESRNLWDSAVRAEGPSTISGFRFTICGTKRAEICGTGAQFMKLRRSRSPVFRCKDQFGGRVPIQRSPGRLDSNLVPQITTRLRRQSQKLRNQSRNCATGKSFVFNEPQSHKLRLSDTGVGFCVGSLDSLRADSVDRRRKRPKTADRGLVRSRSKKPKAVQ